MVVAIRDFLKHEASAGLLLMGSTLLALLLANSPWSASYLDLFRMEVELRAGTFQIEKPLLLWINDGLMAVFFFLVGLELKREVLTGELSNPSQITLPVLAAIGGMAAPALIYLLFNLNDPIAQQGWAIPAATDIAFALGALALLGKRVPVTLKIFLVSVAIVDDLGAIIIIALFYTDKLTLSSLLLASVFLAGLVLLNRRRSDSVAAFLLLGVGLWVCVLKSGVHATLAGVLLAMFIPMRSRDGQSPLHRLEHDLHPAVAFGILPLFAFANAGVPLDGAGLDALLHPVPLGVALGLLLGKPLGILLMCALARLLGWAELPKGVTWNMLIGLGFLAGIGFTMSLFIGSLAFDPGSLPPSVDERLGILAGSALATVLGLWILHLALPRTPAEQQ